MRRVGKALSCSSLQISQKKKIIIGLKELHSKRFIEDLLCILSTKKVNDCSGKYFHNDAVHFINLRNFLGGDLMSQFKKANKPVSLRYSFERQNFVY